MHPMTRRSLLSRSAAIGTTAILPGGFALSTHTFPAKAAQRSGPVGPLPTRGEFIIRGAYVMTMDPALGDISGGDVHVKGDTIVAVGKALKAPGASMVNGERMIVLPGLVET